MTTLSEWENELAALRTDLGPTRPMLMAWAATYETIDGRRHSLARWEVALYAPDALDGDRPIAISYLLASAELPTEQPILAEVAGRLESGSALAFRLPGGTVLYGSLPTREPGFRRWRLRKGRSDKDPSQRASASNSGPSERASWPDWDHTFTIRSVIGLTVFGLAFYADGTGSGSWALICGGLLMAVGGVAVAVIATMRHFGRRP